MPKNPSKPRPPLSLEAAVVATFTDLGGAHAVSAMPGVGKSPTMLFKYGDNSDDSQRHVMPMDLAAFLTAEAVRRGNEPHLFHWFREQFRTSAPEGADGEAALMALAGRMSKEFGDVMSDLAAALNPTGPGGRTLTPSERAKLVGDLRDVARVALGGIDLLETAAL